VATQCPGPNHDVPGTCTMHASSVDLSVTLNALGKTGPPTAPVFVPTPNHDHVVDNSRVNTTPIWWEVRPVLILDQSDWPAADGSSGITSFIAMDDAEAAGTGDLNSLEVIRTTPRGLPCAQNVRSDAQGDIPTRYGIGLLTRASPFRPIIAKCGSGFRIRNYLRLAFLDACCLYCPFFIFFG
jgi:hypothetical protein